MLLACHQRRHKSASMSASKCLPLSGRSGGQIANVRFFRKEELALARAHRKLFKAQKGTHQRAKRRKVHPAYPSQTSSSCGHRQEMPLSLRVYECPSCDLVIDRDHHGSQNILDQALEAVGRAGRVIRRAPRRGSRGESSLTGLIFSFTNRIHYF
jgi:transposase